MSKLKEALGIEPHEIRGENGVFLPSPAAMQQMVEEKTDYDGTEYPDAYKGSDLKILVLCTEENLLPTENGRYFYTGNHPVELFVPLLHLQKAGFTFDFTTISGKPVQLEDWAMPKNDENVTRIREEFRDQMNNPHVLGNVIFKLDDLSPYVGVFIPGGHGALLGLPQSNDVKRLLRWVQKENKYLITLCHGPAALLSAKTLIDDLAEGLEEVTYEDSETFLFNGYRIAAFPDAIDKMLPTIGYLPGQLTWFYGQKLKDLGVHITNILVSGYVEEDRNLLTGDSPKAANKLGKLAAERILAQVNKKIAYTEDQISQLNNDLNDMTADDGLIA